jgi:HPr kinase/phosphorylase
VSILSSQIDTFELLAILIGHLKQYLAPRITRHGVFVEVYGEGLFLTGESGVGKSEAAIELIKRGHRLIADDAVEIKRVDSKTLIGSAPELIRYLIELRGIGIVDVRRIFGSGAIKLSEHIDLVINIENWKDNMSYDRLGTESMETTILGVKVPYITIPIKPGRNLAVILEVAAMNNRQKKMGYNSALEFTERLEKHYEEQFNANNM